MALCATKLTSLKYASHIQTTRRSRRPSIFAVSFVPRPRSAPCYRPMSSMESPDPVVKALQEYTT